MGALKSVPFVFSAALVLAACQSPAPYSPRDTPSGTGYTDQQLTANRYRITFTGNSATRRETVENYLLLRAAEVTLKADYRYFLFDTRDTKTETTYHSDFVGWPGWRGRGGWYWHNWPGWGGNGEVTTRPSTAYEAFAEIVLLTDEQAKNEPRAVPAADVLDHIGPMARPPQP